MVAPAARAEKWLTIPVLHGRCGQLSVVLGTAPAQDLCAVSFADVLDEAAQTGYQRPCDRRHAHEFRQYIEEPHATTIPLTFNARGRPGRSWRLRPRRAAPGTPGVLSIRLPGESDGRVIARVDCQHRLEAMGESEVALTFQCFLGLPPREEMRIFNIINSKAKGLNPSLLDYHETLLVDVAKEHAELFIAKRLNDDQNSAWHNKLNLGGAATQGAHRRVTLRGMRHAVALFLQSALIADVPLLEQYDIVNAFWHAVRTTWPDAWGNHRKHLLTKGIGVQGLSLLAGDIVKLALASGEALTTATFARHLENVKPQNWANTGPLKGWGGRSGAREVHRLLARQLLAARSLRLTQGRMRVGCA